MIVNVGWHNGDRLHYTAEKGVEFLGQPSYESSSIMVYTLCKQVWKLKSYAVQLSCVIAKSLFLYLGYNPVNPFSGQNTLATSMWKKLHQALK
jgi:hypothetical protein